MPTLIVWGERDPMIPSRTGSPRTRSSPTAASSCSRAPATSRSTTTRERFVEVLHDFIAGTEPAVYDEETTRRLLREGAAA